MASSEQKPAQRIAMRIPIRVVGFNAATLKFSEDTQTVALSSAGAFIVLNHAVAPDDVVRIINKENLSEADFRVVGPTLLENNKVREWAVECIESRRNIWGHDLPSQPSGLEQSDLSAHLECRACNGQAKWPVTPMETEVLDSTGAIARPCGRCNKTTYWIYADRARRPREFTASEPVAPPSRAEKGESAERRVSKRVSIKLPTLVRNQKGEDETSQTETVSKGGISLNLAMELKVGEVVTVMCPYTPGGQNIEQRAEVRYRSPFPFGERWLYGLRYLR